MFGNVNDKQYPCICENGMYVVCHTYMQKSETQ